MPERNQDDRIQALIDENAKQDNRISDLEIELKTVLKNHKDAVVALNNTVQKLKQDNQQLWAAIGKRDLMNI
ncbi:MAG: hypothetical protein ACE5KG_03560 [Nitrososphaerales archaeon]